MTELKTVSFAVFESNSKRFADIDPRWSFAWDGAHRGLLAVRANYELAVGVVLMIESYRPGTSTSGWISRSSIGFAVARAGVMEADPRSLIRRARNANQKAEETSLEASLAGVVLVGPAYMYEDYLAGSVAVGHQRVTIAGLDLEKPVELRRHEGPLEYRPLPNGGPA